MAFERGNALRGGHIWVAPIAGGEPKQVTSLEAYSWGYDWSADGRSLIFAGYQPGAARLLGLWRVPATGGPAQLLTVGEQGNSPSVARGGRRLAFVNGLPHRSIWRVGGPNAPSEDAAPRRLVTSTADDYLPRYSPDGREIAFVSSRSGHIELWVAASDGSSARQVTFLEQLSYIPRWSPDGRHIGFVSTMDGNTDAYVVAAAGGIPQRLTTAPGIDLNPTWSRDGKWIYFTSDRSGLTSLWRMPSTGGAATRIAPVEGLFPHESFDRRFVFFTKPGGRGEPGIFRIPAGGGDEEKVVPKGGGHAWELYEGGLCYAVFDALAPSTIECHDLTSGVTRQVAQAGNMTGQGLSVSSDGRWVLYTVDETESDLVLVENFR